MDIILLQYRRIFTLREMRIPIDIVLGIRVAYGIESVITGIFIAFLSMRSGT
jgi:hypothetical protein